MGIIALNNTAVSGNMANGNAGGVVNNNGIATLSNVTVSGNPANGSVGGIVNWCGGGTCIATLTLNNSTVSGNTASTGDGGGIFTFGDGTVTVTLNNATVVGNAAPNGAGGGINHFYGSNVKTILKVPLSAATMVFGHSGESDAQAFSGFTAGIKDVTATSDGTKLTTLSSILNPKLESNGGATKTHALIAGSPAIDLDKACSAPG